MEQECECGNELEYAYTVTMVQHIQERKTPLTFEEDVYASTEDEAIMNMKEELWEMGYDNNQVSVIGARRIILWS